jgi:hypothetical protein
LRFARIKLPIFDDAHCAPAGKHTLAADLFNK